MYVQCFQLSRWLLTYMPYAQRQTPSNVPPYICSVLHPSPLTPPTSRALCPCRRRPKSHRLLSVSFPLQLESSFHPTHSRLLHLIVANSLLVRRRHLIAASTLLRLHKAGASLRNRELLCWCRVHSAICLRRSSLGARWWTLRWALSLYVVICHGMAVPSFFILG